MTVRITKLNVQDYPKCSNIWDMNKQKALADLCSSVISEITGEEVKSKSASTDCNIPLSLGIPAVCIGVYFGEGAHTRQEWVRKDSLKPGLEVAIRVAHTLMENTL